jgi:hypothetical protein
MQFSGTFSAIISYCFSKNNKIRLSYALDNYLSSAGGALPFLPSLRSAG